MQPFVFNFFLITEANVFNWTANEKRNKQAEEKGDEAWQVHRWSLEAY